MEVKITTWVSPYLFWIFDLKTKKRRTALNDVFKECMVSAISTPPVVNETVAVCDKNVWKRGIVKSIVDDVCHCWLLDYGCMYKTSNVFKLPDDLLTYRSLTKLACLHNVVGVRHSLDFLTMTQRRVETKRFSQGVNRSIKAHLERSVSVVFHTMDVIDGILCGRIELTNKDGVTYDLIDELVKENNVAINEDLFKLSFAEYHDEDFAGSGSDSVESCGGVNLPQNMTVECGIGRGTARFPYAGSGSDSVESCGGVHLPQNMAVECGLGHGTARFPVAVKSPSSSVKNETFVQTWMQKNGECLNEDSDTLTLVVGNDVAEANPKKSPMTPQQIVKAHLAELNKHKKSSDGNETSNSRLSDENKTITINSKAQSPQNRLRELVKGRGKRLSDVSNVGSISPSTTNSTDNLIQDCNPRGVPKDENKSQMVGRGRFLALIKSKCNLRSSIDFVESNELFKDANVEPKCESHDKALTETTSKTSASTKDVDCVLNTEPSSSQSTNGSDDSSSVSSKQPVVLLYENSSDSEDSQSAFCPPAKKDIINVGCHCKSCQTWNTNDIGEEDNRFKDVECSRNKNIIKPPLLFKNLDDDEAVEIKTKLKGNMTKIEKNIAPTLLVHGTQIPVPVRCVTDVPFDRCVHKAMRKLKFESAKTIQTYAWPSIMRLQNICMVNGKGTGKTMAYLPAICSFVSEKSERYANLPKENGPIAIILCSGVSKVEETYSLFCTFLMETHKRIPIAYAAPPLDQNCLKSLKKPHDILITTPHSLVTILKLRVVNLKRLCHFVFEEPDRIIKTNPQECYNIMSVVQGMLEHRSCPNGVQIITCSESWTLELENFVKKLYCVPVVCIGAHLESAFYGRADIQMHFLESAVKMSTLCDILKDKSKFFKTVVICNDDKEMDDVVAHLRVEGVLVTVVSHTLMQEEISELEMSWQNTKYGKHSALFCTDVVFNSQLNITNANLLVHYSLPLDSWTTFSKRFKCFIDSYKSPLSSTDSGLCKAHIFVDETNNKQFPRLYEFLKTVGAKLPQRFAHFCAQMEKKEEQRKLKSGVKLCETLKLFGECGKVRCQKRHILSKEVDFKKKLPQSGSVKFHILSVQEVSIYTVRLIEHTDMNGKVTELHDCYDEIGSQLSNAIAQRKIRVVHPKIGERYACFDAEALTYHRCKVVKVNERHAITKLPNIVTVKLIDTGDVQKVVTDSLFELSQKYKDLPPQGVKVYLANILPPQEDSSWSYSSKQIFIEMLEGAGYKNSNSYFSGQIMLQMSGTLWLENVRLVESLTSSDEVVTTLPVKKTLLNKEFVCYREDQLNRLYELCNAEGIDLPNYNRPAVAKVNDKPAQVKPQWAHLEDDVFNAVYFCSGKTPDEFYVRLQEFDHLLTQLQKDIQALIQKPFYPKVEEIIVGNCYLAKDQDGHDGFARAIAMGVKDDIVDCFFVDYGDSMFVSKNDIKFLPDNIITTLPFQVIECKLYGAAPAMDCWIDEATDVLYEYCYEPGTDFYRSLYVSTKSLLQSLISNCHKYLVVLMDFMTQKPVMVNKVLIDCGFAVEVPGEALNDVALPELQQEEAKDETLDPDKEYTITELMEMKDKFVGQESEIKQDDLPISQESEIKQHDLLSSSENIWDIEINNPEEFLKDMLPNRTQSFDGGSTPEAGSLRPMRALPAVNYNTPDLLWSQTEKFIKIDIMVPNVANYDLEIVRGRIFSFRTKIFQKEYKLNFQLFANVTKTVRSSSAGLLVSVTLEKVKSVDWPRITLSETKLRNIKYDSMKCEFPEEKKRLFLDVGEDRADELAEGPVIVIGSDEDYSESDVESESSD